MIASIAQALTLQGANVTRNGTVVTFEDLPALWRLRAIASGCFTVDRAIPDAPVLHLSCHFRELWWILIFLAPAILALSYWSSSNLLAATAAAGAGTVAVGLFAWAMVWIRLRFLIEDVLRGAAS